MADCEGLIHIFIFFKEGQYKVFCFPLFLIAEAENAFSKNKQ